uniref:Molybdate-anion transporter n=1 Tax=Timema shepardi TaxID=629360 RepID=A0A7R9B4M9_TIMSH|nr:unnamed protein product [Timema shepardi]
MLVIAVLCVLSVLSLVLHVIASRAESNTAPGANAGFRKLQRQFFTVYFLATFSDWLQGPYVYKLYSHYGYTDKQIAVLYVIGFGSSVAFGTAVGSLADRIGRKKLCIAYSFLYSICCLTKTTPSYGILVLGRVLGGISTSILFSTFEAWYVHQHIEKYNFPPQWINNTFAEATFFNGILAIAAGIISNLMAEWVGFGPVSPFVFAVPCLAVSGLLTAYSWEENDIKQPQKLGYTTLKALKIIFSASNSSLILLGVIQSLLESVMYIFIFLWTPILEPMSPPLGIVFSCFMVCIMIGSSMYSFLLSRRVRPEHMLTLSMSLAFLALTVCAIATSSPSKPITHACFVAFLSFEISIGIYYPAIGYLRSRVIPEEYRASITSWFRVPMNLLTCVSLLWLRDGKPRADGKQEGQHDGLEKSSHVTFLICACFLLLASLLSTQFTRKFQDSEKKEVLETQLLI